MKYSLNIDAGGTMTDGVLHRAGETFVLKVESTPHDLTLSLVQIIERAAALVGATDAVDLLRDVAFIRWSSTVTSNALAERKGPQLGLIVSDGHRSDLYGAGPSPVIDTLIPEEHVLAIDGATPDPKMIVENVRALLENGVRRICVSLAGSYWDRSTEQAVKQAIGSQYPDHYLGSVPVLAGTDILEWPDDMTRTHYTLVNAYTHPALATSLFKAEDRLRDEFKWRRPFLVGHTNGGVARIGKTKAIDTIESGPVFGTYGAAFLAGRAAVDTLMCLDIGGTTTKASAVRSGHPVRQAAGDLFGIAISKPMQLLRSVAIGGGSHVAIDGSGGVRVGPESAGAAPGPACYGLGGVDATLTDALLVLGYLNPADFLDGRRSLDIEAARAALQRVIADPLSISVAQAAVKARESAAASVAALVESTAATAAIPLSDTVLAVYGGNGPLLGPFVAERLGINRIYVPLRFGPVFGAFGAATCDVTHVYQRGLRELMGGAEQLCDGLVSMQNEARRELTSEGFDYEDAEFRFELSGPDTDPNAPAQTWRATSGDEMDSVAKAIGAAAGHSALERDPRILELHVSLPIATLTLDSAPPAAAQAPVNSGSTFIFGSRPDASLDPVTGPIYAPKSLGAGQSVAGPALISGGTTSCIIPPGWNGRIDDLGNCWMEVE